MENPEALFSACFYPPLKLHHQCYLEIDNIFDMDSYDQFLKKQSRIAAILSDGFEASRTKFVFVHPQDAFLETLELKTLICQYYDERKRHNAEGSHSSQTGNMLTELSYDNLGDELQALRQAQFRLIFMVSAQSKLHHRNRLLL